MEIYEPQIPVGETYSKVLTSIPLSFKAERKRKWQTQMNNQHITNEIPDIDNNHINTVS